MIICLRHHVYINRRSLAPTQPRTQGGWSWLHRGADYLAASRPVAYNKRLNRVMLIIRKTLPLPFTFQQSCENVQICIQYHPLNEVITCCRTFLADLMITVLLKGKFSLLLGNRKVHYHVCESASRPTFYS